MIEKPKPRPPPPFLFRGPRKVGLEKTRSVFRPLKCVFAGPSVNEVESLACSELLVWAALYFWAVLYFWAALFFWAALYF